MNVLLDTCVFLWMALDPRRLSSTARETIEDTGNKLHLSAVSCWEIAVKCGLGQLDLPMSPIDYVVARRAAYGIHPLPLDEQEALSVANLPLHHRDPFDRMLVCQAQSRKMTLLSPDTAFGRYDVRILW